QQILDLGKPRKSSQKGKLKKKPAFRHGKNLQQYGDYRNESPGPRLEFYNIHYNRGNTTPVSPPPPPPPPPRQFIHHDLRRQPNTSPCPSPIEELKALEDDEETLGINMKKAHAATAPVNNTQPAHKNIDLLLSRTPNERIYLRSAQGTLWNTSFQSLRLDQEWNAKSECRATKRTTQIMQHRTDRRYMMNGSALKIQPRYNVADEDLQYLQELSKARQVIKNQVKEEKQLSMPPVSAFPSLLRSSADELEDSGNEEAEGKMEVTPVQNQLEVDQTKLSKPQTSSLRVESPESGYLEDVEMIQVPDVEILCESLTARSTSYVGDLKEPLDEKMFPLQQDCQEQQSVTPELEEAKVSDIGSSQQDCQEKQSVTPDPGVVKVLGIVSSQQDCQEQQSITSEPEGGKASNILSPEQDCHKQQPVSSHPEGVTASDILSSQQDCQEKQLVSPEPESAKVSDNLSSQQDCHEQQPEDVNVSDILSSAQDCQEKQLVSPETESEKVSDNLSTQQDFQEQQGCQEKQLVTASDTLSSEQDCQEQHSVTPEPKGVRFSDILSHQSNSPCGKVIIELGKTTPQPGEAEEEVEHINYRDRMLIKDHLTKTHWCSDGLIRMQPDDGSYSIVPLRKYEQSTKSSNRSQKPCKVQPKHRMESCNKGHHYHAAEFARFPVRKQCYRYSKNVPKTCQCDGRDTPLFFSLQGLQVPLVSKD
ncbi:hypothetical protein SNE40_017561, partial [Patella caerulea]